MTQNAHKGHQVKKGGICSVTAACECLYNMQMKPERKPATPKYVSRMPLATRNISKLKILTSIFYFPVPSTSFVLQRFFHNLFVLMLISMFKYTTIYKRDFCYSIQSSKFLHLGFVVFLVLDWRLTCKWGLGNLFKCKWYSSLWYSSA